MNSSQLVPERLTPELLKAQFNLKRLKAVFQAVLTEYAAGENPELKKFNSLLVDTDGVGEAIAHMAESTLGELDRCEDGDEVPTVCANNAVMLYLGYCLARAQAMELQATAEPATPAT